MKFQTNNYFKMNQHNCACKGIRTCLLCETLKFTNQSKDNYFNEHQKYIYCSECHDKAWPSHISDHLFHKDNLDFISIKGIFVANEIINPTEESYLVNEIDKIEWTQSQSGRRKQDFGPKVNFKKKKCKIGNFKGFPKFTSFLTEFIKNQFDCLNDFSPVELCHLEYCPERGSSIDPHFDDFWLWGERLVTVNLLSQTILTLTKPNDSEIEIRIDLPARSLIVLYDEARYKWHHSIKREDIQSRRIAMTWRELTPQFMLGGQYYQQIGKDILNIAKNQIEYCKESN